MRICSNRTSGVQGERRKRSVGRDKLARGRDLRSVGGFLSIFYDSSALQVILLSRTTMDRSTSMPSIPNQATTSHSSATRASIVFIASAGTLSPLSSTLKISAANAERKTSASRIQSAPVMDASSFPLVDAGDRENVWQSSDERSWNQDGSSSTGEYIRRTEFDVIVYKWTSPLRSVNRCLEASAKASCSRISLGPAPSHPLQFPWLPQFLRLVDWVCISVDGKDVDGFSLLIIFSPFGGTPRQQTPTSQCQEIWLEEGEMQIELGAGYDLGLVSFRVCLLNSPIPYLIPDYYT